jgi:hypothetical protein
MGLAGTPMSRNAASAPSCATRVLRSRHVDDVAAVLAPLPARGASLTLHTALAERNSRPFWYYHRGDEGEREADVRCWQGGEMLKGRHEERHFVLDFVRAGNAPNRAYSGNERLTPRRDRIS